MEKRLGILLELEFGDSELVVRRHPDGMVTIDIPEPRLLVNEAQFQQIVKGFRNINRVPKDPEAPPVPRARAKRDSYQRRKEIA